MRTRTLAAPLLGLTLVLAACSSSGGGASTPSAAAATAPPASEAPSESAAAASPSESAAAAGGPTVNLGETSLGSVLVDGDGKTLYIFTPDAASAGKSVCNGDCAAAWPPLLGDAAPTLGTGLEAGDFTTITRDDGATQIAFYGMPLYYFAADAAAGDVKGQGLNDKWYVIGADGTPIK
jgi:predicted lipoprotein with Yx(FWY)xxD motif